MIKKLRRAAMSSSSWQSHTNYWTIV